MTLQLAAHDVAARYRGSLFGVVWSLLTPLSMLAVFTVIFGGVFQVRWHAPINPGGPGPGTTPHFAVVLFSGLIVFQLFSDAVTRAPGVIVGHVNYVKKVVFPLEVLPVAALTSCVFNTGLGMVALCGAVAVLRGGLPISVLLLPVVLAPFIIFILGLVWFLASLGVYLRDINHALGACMTGLLFLSPVFYPVDALPVWLRPWLVLNPITLPVQQVRDVVVFGIVPDLFALGLYAVPALCVCALGYTWFQKTRRGFADVL